MISSHQHEPDATDTHVGKRIRMRRMMLKMSQTTLADGVGITFQQIQKYEKGTNRVSASRLQQFVKLLEVPISFFFDGGPAAKVAGGGKISRKEAESPAYVADFLANQNGQNIVKAFNRIEDRKLRHSIVLLVEQLVGIKPKLKRVAP
ncbi:MAG: helix-turn-helix transcriptional regulator [Xanthobacteraceae bacterium]